MTTTFESDHLDAPPPYSLLPVSIQERGGPSHNTPLHIAASSGDIEAVTTLLNQGTDVDAARDKDGATPLHTAVRHGHLEIVKILIKHGANLKARSDSNLTILHRAASAGHLPIAKYLVEQCKAKIHAKDNADQTPLHVAASHGRLDMVGWLVEKGADIHAKVYKGTPLHLAARYGHMDVVLYLVEQGASIDVTNKDGRTPYQEAKFFGEPVIAEWLLTVTRERAQARMVSSMVLNSGERIRTLFASKRDH